MNEQPLPASILCPRCGGVVTTGARFCQHCAFDLAAAVPPAPPMQPAYQTETSARRLPGVNSKYLLLAGGLVLALACGALFIYYKGRATAPPAAAGPTVSDKAKQVEERILQGAPVSNAELVGLSAYELRVLRNAHFARYGRVYERPGLGDYFYTRSWYKPSSDYNDNLLTATDKANINLILAEENKAKAAEAAQATNAATASAAASSPTNSLPAAGWNSSANGPSSAAAIAAINAMVKNMLNRAEMVGSWKTVEVKSAAVQIDRQGIYNEQQKYLAVQATVTGSSRKQPEFWMGDGKPSENCQFSFSAEYKIQKNDYGDWIAVPHPFWQGPVRAKCDK